MRARRERALGWIGLGAGLAAGAALARSLDAHALGAWLPATLVLGYVSADLLSGLVHWTLDRFGSEETPLLGPTLIRFFREHHHRPEAIAGSDFVTSCGGSALLLAPVLGAVELALPAEPLGPPALRAWVLACGLAGCLTNEFHRWAHLARPPAGVALLQRLGLVLPPEHHRVHHRGPGDRHYCITTGWCDASLERLRVFARLEALVGRRGTGEG